MGEPIDERPGGLLAWQWAGYRSRHGARANLAVHIVTNPIFLAGNLVTLSSPFTHAWFALLGLAMSLSAFGVQGVMHKKVEALAPEPFRGRFDIVARTFCEQWITFPRFVLSGALGRAWSGRE